MTPSTGTVKTGSAPGEEITALSRGLALLRSVAAAGGPVSNGELADLTGIPKPSVSRITATLVGAGFLLQLPDSERFILTAAVLELSNGFLRNFDIRDRVRPFLTELAERTSLSVHLVTRDRLDMVVLEAVQPQSAILVSRLAIGSRMDLTRTAAGRAYLAVTGEDERRALMIGMQAAHGSDWPQVYQRLTSAIAETQASGVALVTGDWHESVSAIALGFVGPSGERYVVSCGAAAHLAPREWLAAQAAPALIDCVKRIVDEIGGAPHLRLAD